MQFEPVPLEQRVTALIAIQLLDGRKETILM
jgi:hypothetical protein